MNTPTLSLKSGHSIPKIGLGTWQVKGQECQTAIADAIKMGYRHIDTAEHYDNQVDIGVALHKLFTENVVAREEVFITSKLWVEHFQPDLARQELTQTLEDLQTEYIDLWLIHWPHPNLNIEEILPVMIEAKDQGKVRSVGVSNFPIHLLEQISDELMAHIDVNQVEFHPSLYQKELLEYCQNKNIVVEAYSPLVQGADLQLPLIQELAEKYQVSTAQVVLQWLLAKDIVVLPRSSDPAHQQDNLQSHELELSSEDSTRIDELEDWNRLLNIEKWVDFKDSER